MSLHDAYARRTPLEIAFPDAAALGSLADEIAVEAKARGLDPTDPGSFVALPAAMRAVGTLGDAEDEAAAMIRFGPLLFHAVHSVLAGRPLYLLPTTVVRALVRDPPSAEPVPPAPGGYLQLPQHLFWTTATPDDPPESLDGAFWTVSAAGDLHVLAITGVRPDRPGFGAVPLPEAPLDEARAWVDAEVREHGTDFESTLKGAELDELYSVQAAGELLKLVAAFFALASTGAGEVEAGEPPHPTTHGPAASELPYTRLSAGA